MTSNYLAILPNLLPVVCSALGLLLALALKGSFPRGAQTLSMGSGLAFIVSALGAAPIVLFVLSLESHQSLGEMGMATLFWALMSTGAALIAFVVGLPIGWLMSRSSPAATPAEQGDDEEEDEEEDEEGEEEPADRSAEEEGPAAVPPEKPWR